MKYGIIYKITNILNQKCYIGQTTKTAEIRFNQHKRFNKRSKISYAIKKYGANNFKIETLEIAYEIELEYLEKYYIQIYDSIKNGYNITSGGKVLRGAFNPFFGKTHSEKTRKIISEANKIPKPKSDFHKLKMSNLYKDKNNPFFGCKHNDESKEKMRKASTGKIKSKEIRDKIGKKNRKLNDQQINYVILLINENNMNLSQIAQFLKIDRAIVSRINNKKYKTFFNPNDDQ